MKKLLSTLCLSTLVSVAILSCQKDESATPQNDAALGKLSNAKATKVTICHKPDGANPITISVAQEAVAAHLAHGDNLGECGSIVTPD
ncbi:hypothetical protein [Fibrivirga algicola]|uniref:Uncharacterized protein n=1 Tax=Fibrivirga algicola TaxID=2950420 RepID=A0ABX0QNK3_9BACT|nr:hypothetical protein [Fibrivirga algicola]ARK11754.1 hypothetical protein A6C57_16240 [Fibrella sp. ES10-3-2-2]NID13358.1 hypothetical protein [Fibrivirga algicola]